MQPAPTLKIIDSVGDELAVRVSVPGAWIQFCENFAGQLGSLGSLGMGSGSGPLQKLNHGLRLGIRLFAIDPAYLDAEPIEIPPLGPMTPEGNGGAGSETQPGGPVTKNAGLEVQTPFHTFRWGPREYTYLLSTGDAVFESMFPRSAWETGAEDQNKDKKGATIMLAKVWINKAGRLVTHTRESNRVKFA